MEIGIVGLPNVGKSTFFNVLTKANAAASNFPFTTIEPNHGIVAVPDERLTKLGEIFKPEKLTPTTIKFVDIAGLVKNAHKGEGLGNKFLSHIREVDAVVQVVRLFSQNEVVNVLGEIKPIEEINIVATELLLSDLEVLQRAREKILGLARCGNQEAKEQVTFLEQIIEQVNTGIPIRKLGLPEDKIKSYQLLTTKPIFYVLNVDESGNKELVDQVINYLQKENTGAVPFCIKLEQELSELSPEESELFREEWNLKDSGLEKIVKSGLQLLQLLTFYTVVGKEVRAWLIPEGTAVDKAAGKIHTDMEKGFIRAEVYTFTELDKYGTEKNLHEHGLVRKEGRDYVVKDGDILQILFAVK